MKTVYILKSADDKGRSIYLNSIKTGLTSFTSFFAMHFSTKEQADLIGKELGFETLKYETQYA